MERAVWVFRVGLVLLLVLPLLAVAAVDESNDWEVDEVERRQLKALSDRNFEHDTQAATGQTTGHWMVLFAGPECDKCKDAEQAILEAASQLQQPILAQVNVLDSPKTFKRFLVSEVPEVRLFRDRRMFTYRGGWDAASISAFLQGSWKDEVGQDVPAETSLIAEYLEGLGKIWQASLEYLSKRPGVLAGIGAILATGAYIVTRQMLGLKPLKKRKRMPRPHGRPLRKRAA